MSGDILNFENWFCAEFSWEWDDDLEEKVGFDNWYLYIYNENIDNVENMTTHSIASVFELMSKGNHRLPAEKAKHILQHLKKNTMSSGKYSFIVRDMDRDESADYIMLEAFKQDEKASDFFILKNGNVSHLDKSLLQSMW